MYLIFVSSLNENVKLANLIQEQLKELDKESEVINVVEMGLPMYDSYKEEHDGIPNSVNDLSIKMQNADGYIMVAPEYNYSIPPVLTNVIAWVSRIGDDFRKLFAGKFIQLATHSGGGGNDLMNAMRIQFTKLGSLVMPREIITNYGKPFSKESSKRILEQFISLKKEEK